MPSAFPRSPKLLKGALVVYESHRQGSSSEVIVFQYNPDQLSRTVQHQSGRAAGDGRTRGEAQEDVYRVEGAPRETINMTVILNAADQLEVPQNNRAVVENGLHPVLATLEMLLYPTTDQVRQQESRANEGEVQLASASLPLTLLVWGKSRVVPILIQNFSVAEEAFDPKLDPIQARVEIALRVLSDTDLPSYSMGRDIYRAYQSQKENLARKYHSGAEMSGVIRGLIPRRARG